MIQIDMPMPENCADCCFATADLVNGKITLFCMTQAGRRMFAPDLINRKDRPEWCPLKEQKTVEPEVEVLNEIDRLYRCPRCHKHFFYEKQKYCDQCGQAVKWE